MSQAINLSREKREKEKEQSFSVFLILSPFCRFSGNKLAEGKIEKNILRMARGRCLMVVVVVVVVFLCKQGRMKRGKFLLIFSFFLFEKFEK